MIPRLSLRVQRGLSIGGAIAFNMALLLGLSWLNREPEVDVRRSPERVSVLRMALPEPPPPPPEIEDEEPPAEDELPDPNLPPLAPPELLPVDVPPAPVVPSLLPPMGLPAPRVVRTQPSQPSARPEDPGPPPEDPPVRATGPMEEQNVDQPPRELPGNPPPVYPRLAKRRQIQGSVLIRMLVDVNGRVTDWQILQTQGHASFAPAVEKVLPRLRFSGGQHEGREVQVWIRKTFTFVVRAREVSR